MMAKDIKDYNIWRKNTPLLYTQLHTSSLLWPSLSIDWLPDTFHSLNNNDSISTNHRLILSSFSNGYNKQEALLITETKLIDFNNKNIKNLQNFDYLSNSNEFNYSLPLPHLNNTKELIQSNNNNNNNNNLVINLDSKSNHSNHSNHSITKDNINDIEITSNTINTNSIPFSKVNNSIGLLQRIPHLGDINRIKYCPQNPDLIATSSDSGNIRIFDRTRKPNNFNDNDNDNDINLQNNVESADILLNFHNSESWSLDWNYHKKFTLATASNDGSIAIWNLNNQFKKPPKQKFSTLNSNYNNSTCILSIPQLTIPAHDFGVNEIKWLPDHDSLLLSVGEDSCIKLWDIRNPTSNQQVLKFTTLNPLNTLDINLFQTFNFISGSSIGEIFNLDLRNNNNTEKNLIIPNISSHTDSITSTKFSPHLKNTFATSSNDGKVIIWRDNKPIFTHHGHLLAVNDICWCPSEKGILASCSNDNSVHVWQPIL
jgi:histone-binding protein RBBP4